MNERPERDPAGRAGGPRSQGQPGAEVRSQPAAQVCAAAGGALPPGAPGWIPRSAVPDLEVTVIFEQGPYISIAHGVRWDDMFLCVGVWFPLLTTRVDPYSTHESVGQRGVFCFVSQSFIFL